MHSNHANEGAASASPVGEVDSLAEARALIAKDSQERMQACAEEVQAVLEKYGMRLDVAPPQISIIPA